MFRVMGMQDEPISYQGKYVALSVGFENLDDAYKACDFIRAQNIIRIGHGIATGISTNYLSVIVCNEPDNDQPWKETS